jgi:hypothetical protein
LPGYSARNLCSPSTAAASHIRHPVPPSSASCYDPLRSQPLARRDPWQR